MVLGRPPHTRDCAAKRRPQPLHTWQLDGLSCSITTDAIRANAQGRCGQCQQRYPQHGSVQVLSDSTLSITLTENSGTTIIPLARSSDVDVDVDTLSATDMTAPAHGRLTQNTDGSFS